MEQFTFIKNYKTNDQLRASFNNLAMKTFDINFEDWYQNNFWNDRYICYSYLDGDKVVSNASINLLDMFIDGQKRRAIQIGTVMTDPDYRKKGLASSLMNKIYADFENDVDLFFLFCEEHNFDFYAKLGLTPVQQSQFVAKVAANSTQQNLRKLSIDNEDDKQLLLNAYKNKRVSHYLDFENAEHLLGFYALLSFGDHIYFIEKLKTVTIFSIKEDKLHLYAVFSEDHLNFHDLMKHIATENVKEVIFHFTPDFTDVTPEITPIEALDDVFHLKSKTVVLNKPFKFPLIAHA